MDTLHTVLRTIRGETKSRRDHLTVFREFLHHLDRIGRKPRASVKNKSAKAAAGAASSAMRVIAGLDPAIHPSNAQALRWTRGSSPRVTAECVRCRTLRMRGSIMLAPLTDDFARPAAAIAPDGTVEGYASLFGEIDQARDMVMPGAFDAIAAPARRAARADAVPARSVRADRRLARAARGHARALCARPAHPRGGAGARAAGAAQRRRRRRALDRLSHREGPRRSEDPHPQARGDRSLGDFDRDVPAAPGGARPRREGGWLASPPGRPFTRGRATRAPSTPSMARFERGAPVPAASRSTSSTETKVSSCPNPRGNPWTSTFTPTRPRSRPASPAAADAVTHDDVMRLFEDFKAANDERLDADRAALRRRRHRGQGRAHQRRR